MKFFRNAGLAVAILLSSLAVADHVDGHPSEPLANFDFTFTPAFHDAEVVYVGSVDRKSHGSGFWVTPQLIVTAAHVVSERTEDDKIGGPVPFVIVRNNLDETTIARVVYHDAHQDLAVLQVATPISAAPAILSTADPVRGEHVYSIGHMLAWEWSLTSGFVAQTSAPIGRYTDRLLLSMVTSFGNSGGPVYDERGRVIGIVTQIVQGGVSLALPVSEILPIVRQAKARY